MYDLSAFRNRVRELCRRSSPHNDYRKPSLADLASAIGLIRTELSRRLNGSNRPTLSRSTASAIVRTLVEWGAITSRPEVIELLALVGHPPPDAAQWEAAPLDPLPTSPLTTTMSSGNAPTALAQRGAAVAHQPESSRIAVGRAYELAELAVALDKHNCVVVAGSGGIGKSTFAAMYAAANNYRTVCWRNLHHNPNFADFTEALMSILGLPFEVETIPRPQEQASHIAGLLRQPAAPRRSQRSQTGELLIVLNNFESVMSSSGVVEPGWQELLVLANEGLGTSRILITTRELPAISAGGGLHRFVLPGLSSADGAALLDALGIRASQDELEQAVALAGGHPLALIFLADLCDNQGYTVADLLRETLWSERIAQRLLDKIYQRLSAAAQGALTYLSVFSEPASATTIAGMLAHLPALPPLPYLDRKGSWDEATVRDICSMLIQHSLVDTDVAGRYQLHPIVREYAYSHLAAAAYHEAAASYFQSIYAHDPYTNPPADVSDVQPLLNAIDHFCAAGDYEAAYNVYITGRKYISEKWFPHLSMLLAGWGEYMRVMAICRRLAEAPPERLSGKKRSVAFNNLGIVYRNLGQYDAAIACYQRGLPIADQVDTRNKLNLLVNLAVAYEHLKDYDRAIDYNQQVLALVGPDEHRPPLGGVWTSLGNIYGIKGDQARALDSYQRARIVSEEDNDRIGLCTDMANIGEAYFNLGQVERALKHYEQALTMAELLRHLSLQGWVWQSLGRALQQGVRGIDALACYLKALSLRERLGNPEDVAETRDSISSLRDLVSEAPWETLIAQAEGFAADPAWRPVTGASD